MAFFAASFRKYVRQSHFFLHCQAYFCHHERIRILPLWFTSCLIHTCGAWAIGFTPPSTPVPSKPFTCQSPLQSPSKKKRNTWTRGTRSLKGYSSYHHAALFSFRWLQSLILRSPRTPDFWTQARQGHTASRFDPHSSLAPQLRSVARNGCSLRS